MNSFFGERFSPGSSLDFQRFVFVGHNYIQIYFSPGVLLMTKVAQHIAVYNAGAYGSDRFIQGNQLCIYTTTRRKSQSSVS